MPYALNEDGDLVWEDDFTSETDETLYPPADPSVDPEPEQVSKEPTAKSVDKEGSDWATGSPTGDVAGIKPLSWLARQAKDLGIEEKTLKALIGAGGGALIGNLLAREANKNIRRFDPQGIGHGSGQLAEYKFTPTVGTGIQGSGGRGYPAGGGNYFTKTPTAGGGIGQAPVFGANGVMYPSPAAARAAGETNFTYQAPVGVTPPAGGGIGQRPPGLPGLQGNQLLVDQAYRSLFGRSADPTGLAFFGKGLDTGQINQQNLLENIRRGAQGADKDLLTKAPIGGWTYAAGGQTPTGLGYLRSAEDGMADRIPATIDDRQPAKLSGGEFVIPADVVSHLGNGNSDAGAKQLHDFMARIRKARTGNQAQGKRIDPTKFFPKGRG